MFVPSSSKHSWHVCLFGVDCVCELIFVCVCESEVLDNLVECTEDTMEPLYNFTTGVEETLIAIKPYFSLIDISDYTCFP